MRVAREIPPNPNIVVYHTDRVLTTRIVEAYRSEDGAPPRHVRALLERGAVSVHVTRYRMSVRKPQDRGMFAFLGDVEPALCVWSGQAVIPVAPDRNPKWQAFDVSFDPTLDRRRVVYESSDGAESNVTAAALFRVPGVAELVLVPDSVTVAKGALFPWSELALQVQKTLRADVPARAGLG